MLGQPVHHWLRMERGLADPIRQNSTVQIKTRPRQAGQVKVASSSRL